MNEKGYFRIPRIWLILAIIAIVIVVCIFIGVMISNNKEEPKNEVQNISETIDNIVSENKVVDEIAKDALDKIEVNKIAEKNCTIDGRIPCFYNPVIPTGFRAITNEQDSTIDENAKWGVYNAYLYGLVIEDENKNQFVWIPVENMEIFKTTDWQKNKPKETIDSTYIEPIAQEKDEYQKMCQKVKKYGGFYVGRYETGDITATSERAEIKNSDDIGIRKYLNVYNYVPFKISNINKREITGAQELAVNFGKNNKYETVTTSVVYGTQWDSILRFIASDENNVNDSIKWGNYSSSQLDYTDINKNTYQKKSGEVRLLKAGASEQTKAKNIYDLAGNAYEWTTESSGTDVRIVRGGSYVVTIGQLAASRYAYNYNTANNAIGFRISFYID